MCRGRFFVLGSLPDKATQDFLWGFVREQVEEEATAKNIVEKLKLYGEHHAVLMDHRLGKR